MLWVGDWLRKKITALLERYRRRASAHVHRPPPAGPPPKPPHPDPTPRGSFRSTYDDRFGYAPEAAADPEPEHVTRTISEAIPEPGHYSRAERRALERRRRRHDKFVTPKGASPRTKKPKEDEVEGPMKNPPIKRAKVEMIELPPTFKDNTIYIHGKHHEDTEEVIYYETEMYGEFNFRDTILQQLDRYWVYLARMQKHDPQAYHFYRQYGATLLPYVNTASHDRGGTSEEEKPYFKKQMPVPTWFHETRPSFGCFAYGADHATEKFELESGLSKDGKKHHRWVPKFMYFTKYKCPPPELQMMSGGDIYSMTVYWDRPHDPKYKDKLKWGVPQEFGIFISRDGKQVVALRVCDTKMIPIWSKRKHRTFHIPERAWHIPGEFERWAKENKEDPQTFLTGLFVDAITRYEYTQYSMARVAVSKGDMTATFGLNIHRTAYFFQDRDITINQNGSRRQVFHMVKAHQRKDGTLIKFYFKGEKEFTWAGYDVLITIPGRDHLIYADFNVGSEDEYWWRNKSEKKKYADMEELGRRFAADIKSGHGKMH